MLRFNEILIVFWTLVGLGLVGAPLKLLEKKMGQLAVETSKHGYMSLADFHSQLEGGSGNPLSNDHISKIARPKKIDSTNTK